MAPSTTVPPGMPATVYRLNRALALALGTALMVFAAVYYRDSQTLFAILPLVVGLAVFLFPAIGRAATFQPIFASWLVTVVRVIGLIGILAAIYYTLGQPDLSIRRIEGQQPDGQCGIDCTVTLGGRGVASLLIGSRLVMYGPQARLTESGYTEAPIGAVEVFDVQPQIALAQVVLVHQNAQNDVSRRLQTGLRVARVDILDNPLLIPVFGDGFVYTAGSIYLKPAVVGHVGDFVDVLSLQARGGRVFDTIPITTGVQLITVGENGRSAQFDPAKDKHLSIGAVIRVRPITVEGEAAAAYASAKSWPIVLKEDFSSNQNNWPTGTFERRYGHEEATLRDGQYQLAITPANAHEGESEYETANAVSLTDFSLEVDVKNVSGPETGSCGLAFRWYQGDKEDDFYYYFRIRGNTYALTALLPGTGWQSIISSKFSPHIHLSQMNKLAVLANGDRFRLFINGEYADETINTTIKRGEVRLVAQNIDSVEMVTCQFDNFELHAPPSP